MKDLLIITGVVAGFFTTIICAADFVLDEVSATSYSATWTGNGWKFDRQPPEGMISTPFGFMHNIVLSGDSYTLTIPRARIGWQKSARVTIWRTGKTFR